MIGVVSLSRIRLNASDPGALAQFFIEGLGFQSCAGPGGAPQTTALMLGATRLDIAAAGANARPYPADVAGWNPLFQHFAIVTRDMAQAMRRLEKIAGWTAISRDGPQRLPSSSGGVTAFKFRDPEGHPLELLAFPENVFDEPKAASGDPCLHIDHSAISVADVDTSIAFYRSLGLVKGGRSLNRGPEQERLDAIDHAVVDVVPLRIPNRKPHVELLHYRGIYDRRVTLPQPGDIAATRLVFAVADSAGLAEVAERFADRRVPRPTEDDPARALLRDPDGHLIEIEAMQ